MSDPVPIFTRPDDTWHATPQAMGPFGGLHGGVVSGLLTGELEMIAATAGHGPAVSATIYLLRPAPLTALETRPTPVREGGRVAVYENELWADGKLQAKASMGFLRPLQADRSITAMPSAIAGSTIGTPILDPATFSDWDFPRNASRRSYLDAVDVRESTDGTIWVRGLQPLFSQATPFATAVSFADFSTLFSVVSAGARPNAAGWPNADLSVHLSRLPEGPWIGLRTRSDWFADGRGTTEAEIWDVYGRIGRSTQAVVLAAAS